MNTIRETNKLKFAEVQKEQRALKVTYDRVFASPDGQQIMDDLEKRFNGSALRKSKEGVVDPTAMIFASGGREVLLYIQLMRIPHAVD